MKYLALRLNSAVLMVGLLLWAPVVLAVGEDGGFVPLSPNLPLMDDTWSGGFTGLLNSLLGMSVALAAILAVIMLAIGGFKYMTTDSVFAMGSAKEQISNAIIGLLIVLTSILFLKTINPDLISLDIFRHAGTSASAPNPSSAPSTPSTPSNPSDEWNGVYLGGTPIAPPSQPITGGGF